MYSRKSWGGDTDPFILVKFIKPDDVIEEEDPIVSLVIFEWQDRPLIGAEVPTKDGEGTMVRLRHASVTSEFTLTSRRESTYVTRELAKPTFVTRLT